MPHRARPVTHRVRAVAVAVVGVVAVALVGPSATASPHRPSGPSAAQVRQAHRAAAVAASALVTAQQREADAAARLDALNARVEALVEAWDGARAAADSATADLAAAQARADAAQASADAAQVDVDRLAAASYQVGADLSGGLGEWASVLDSAFRPGGVSTLADRLAEVAQVAADRRHQIDSATALRFAALQTQQQAAAAASALQANQAAAAAAYAAVLAAQAAQRGEVLRLTAQLAAARTALASAQRHATALDRARAAAIAQAEAERRAAAARAAAAAAILARQQQTSGWRPPFYGAGPVGWPSGQSVTTAAQRLEAVAVAEAQLGKPYVAGGRGPSTYDCSGLTAYAYHAAGVPMIAYSKTQFAAGEKIPVTQLQPGDLVFYAFDPTDWTTIHHVGMYVGHGTMVEAPHTGAFVRYTNIWMPGLVAFGVRP